MDRREFISSVGGVTLGMSLGRAEQKGKAPFHVIFSNDLTNIITVSSPYHKKAQPIPYEGAGSL